MRIAYKTLGIYFAFLLQSLFFENLRIGSCSPDLLLAVLVIVAVSEDFVPAAILGAFTGLLTDVMYGRVFGINILFYMCLALLVGIAADKKNSNSPLIMSWICFVSIAAMEIVLGILKTGMGRKISLGMVCTNVFVKGIFAALFALGFVLVMLKIKKRKEIEKETVMEKDSEKEDDK